jgi:inward rectifier potassium channel
MSHPYRKQKFKNIDNTGFAANSNAEGARITNKDGSTNLRKVGLPFWERISIYHTLIRMSRFYFLLCVLLFYTVINLFFAALYYFIGVQHLTGTDGVSNEFYKFMDAFFFSSQTLTTVGYGHVAPTGMITNVVASIESLVGIVSFALVTGLIYGRFARPRAYLIFSKEALIAPYKDGTSLMMRMATYKNNYLTDVEAVMTLALHVLEGERTVTHFYQLPLEFNKVSSLALSWTLVHPIDENSPLYGFTEEDFNETRMELIVVVKAFDDHFSNIVQQRTSYTHKELIYGAKFVPMFQRSTDKSKTLLELQKIGLYEKVTLPSLQLDFSENKTIEAKL